MKILKIFGVVVGFHLFALILIFANPGCSSTSKPPPAPVDTAASDASPATINVPPLGADAGASPMSSAAIDFNPDAPASLGGGSSSIRFTPTRPGTPAASTLVTAPVADVTPATTYIVVSGDNLWTLARKNGITVSALASTNGLRSDVILQPGQKLIIPGKTVTSTGAGQGGAMPSATGAGNGAAAKPPAAPAGNGSLKHVMKPRETLSGIAQQYGVTVRDLGTVNHITDPRNLRPGTELIIPGWNSTGSGKSASRPADTIPAAAPAPADTRPNFNIVDPNTPMSAPPPSNDVPVIRVEDNPMSPAPKSN